MMFAVFLAPCIIAFVHSRESQVASAEGEFNAAFDLYQQAVVDVIDGLNIEIASVNLLKSAIAQIIPSFGEDLLTYRFYQEASSLLSGLLKVEAAIGVAGFITISRNTLQELAIIGPKFVTPCVFQAKGLMSDLNQYQINASLEISAVNINLTLFKAAAEKKCRRSSVANLGNTKACLESVKHLYPLPAQTDIGRQTDEFLTKMFNCFNIAATEAQRTLEAIHANVRVSTPPKFSHLFPDKLFTQNLSKIEFSPARSFVLPPEVDQKQQEVKTILETTSKTVQDAVRSKYIPLAQAIASLQPNIKNLRSFAEESEQMATPEEKPCYEEARAFLQYGPEQRGAELMNCAESAGKLPTSAEIISIEKRVRDRELQEKYYRPVIQCAIQSQNLFRPNKMQQCFQRAYDEYILFLNGVYLEVEILYEAATIVLDKVERCYSKAEGGIEIAAKAQLYKLGECVSQTSKLRMQVPDQPCVKKNCKYTI